MELRGQLGAALPLLHAALLLLHAALLGCALLAGLAQSQLRLELLELRLQLLRRQLLHIRRQRHRLAPAPPPACARLPDRQPRRASRAAGVGRNAPAAEGWGAARRRA